MVNEEGAWKSHGKRGQERGERERRLEAQPRLLGSIQELLGEVPGSFSPAFQLHENHIHSVSEGRGWEQPTTLQRDEHLRNSLRVKTATPQSEGGAVVSSVDTHKQSRTCSTPPPALLNKPLLQIHISFGFLVENASQPHRKAADSQSLSLLFFCSSSNEKNDGVISGLAHLICQTRGQPPQQAGQPVHSWPGP